MDCKLYNFTWDWRAKDVVPRDQLGSKPSELIIILAVWVAVGKSGVTCSQESQDVLQLAGSPEDFRVWVGSRPTLSEEDIYPLLHQGGELPLEKSRQHLLTHQY